MRILGVDPGAVSDAYVLLGVIVGGALHGL